VSRTDRASRVIAAPPARVFAAFVDARALVRWLPPTGMSARFEHFESRPGGSYRMVLTYDDPAITAGKSDPGRDVVEARFVEIVPDTRIVQTVEFASDDPAFAGTMTMTWAVAETPGGSRVTFTADDVPDGISPEDHANGMAASLANLARLVER
jgi:uncharacterized protein YndB with AHSA1/START domain